MDNRHLNKFVKIQKAYFAQEQKDIAHLQSLGTYPSSFSLPIGIQLELTAKCNLACVHCYNRSGSNGTDAMTIPHWLRTIEDINAFGGVFQCILSGGEPLLLGDALFDLMEPFDRNGTAFILITNGYLVTESIVEKLRKYQFYWIQVSIDAFDEAEHDNFRGRSGSWKNAVMAAYLFSSAGFPLRVAHSVHPGNLPKIEQFIDFVYRLGASSVVIGPVMLSGRVAENRHLLMSDENLDQMYEVIERTKQKYTGRMAVLPGMTEQMSKEVKQDTPNTSVIIRPNGDVRLDCTMPFTIGNVLKRPFSEIWNDYGNICWQDERVRAYVRSSESNSLFINHYTPDIALY